ncbi:universal stress protein [Streptomyces sp. RLB1-33]|uniref:universal stress protein n=1 Tax=Streptomyces mirabilis TaxID=68239 RepID=UPI00143E7C83|nr:MULTISPECIES: universal stress protein [Streptomyces]QIY72665.1 universal stress protein [Streptomyces sp. RLB1-33]QUW80374.1 universal stress protein [Streptomyces mirabilis]
MSEEERGPRVVAGVSGSPGSLAALRRAAAEARRGGAELLVVIAWEPPGGDFAHRSALSPLPMAMLRRDAGRRLLAALDTAFGDAGPGIPYRGLVVRGTPGRALVETADRADDLLVVGPGCRGRLHRSLFPSVARYCLAHAVCPVLTLPPSPLSRELASVHRRIRLWLPLDARELTEDRS